MGEKGLSGTAGSDDAADDRDDAATPEPSLDDTVWQPAYEPEPAYASDDFDDRSMAAEG